MSLDDRVKGAAGSKATSSRRPDARAVSSQGRLLTVKQVAERLGTTQEFPRRLIKERRITYVKLGPGRRSPVRIPESVLEEFIAGCTVEASN